MTREEIEKLGITISKRLGKKANALWWKAQRDLVFADIVRNHITRVVKYEAKKITPDYKIEADVYYSYISRQLDEEAMIFITEWLKNNINKDILREWLNDETK